VWLAGGTVVGINPWVAARDKEVYGEDSGTFRPERWLDADEQELKAMERNFLAVSLRVPIPLPPSWLR
jgi:cytochrome P450